MRNRALATHLLLLLLGSGFSGMAEEEPNPLVEKSFIILKSTSSYDEAHSLANSAASRLNVKLDLRDLSADATLGLTFPRSMCEKEWGEFPCYWPRGRYDEGVYLSIEHSSGYKGFTPGLYIVVLASGSKEEARVREALEQARAVYPDAYERTALVYLGCMH